MPLMTGAKSAVLKPDRFGITGECCGTFEYFNVNSCFQTGNKRRNNSNKTMDYALQNSTM